jgi:NADH:ubiquinone oxidoreductase subunit 6 (subunit J)
VNHGGMISRTTNAVFSVICLGIAAAAGWNAFLLNRFNFVASLGAFFLFVALSFLFAISTLKSETLRKNIYHAFIVLVLVGILTGMLLPVMSH